jgi:hypothetical protein
MIHQGDEALRDASADSRHAVNSIMAWLDRHDIVHFRIDVVIFNKVEVTSVDMSLMFLDTRAEQRDILVILFRPSIISSGMVSSNLLAHVAIDAETYVANQDGPAGGSILLHVEDRGLFPVNLVMAINEKVLKILRSPCATPCVVILGLRLELGNVESPTIDCCIKLGRHFVHLELKHVALDADNGGLNPAFCLFLLVSHDQNVEAFAFFQLVSPRLTSSG